MLSLVDSRLYLKDNEVPLLHFLCMHFISSFSHSAHLVIYSHVEALLSKVPPLGNRSLTYFCLVCVLLLVPIMSLQIYFFPELFPTQRMP